MVSNARAGAMGMALAHEVSQPLSTVATYLHAARRLLQSSGASEPVMDALVKAEAEAQRAREVLERIRDFVSNGNLDLKALDLSAVAHKIGALCGEERSNAVFTWRLKASVPSPRCRRTGSRLSKF